MRQYSMRRVHFDEQFLEEKHSNKSSKNQAPLAIPDEDMKNIWWSKVELESFQNNINLLVREISKRESNTQIYSFQKLLIEIFIRCDDVQGPTQEQRHYLRQWVKSAISLRGIENLCSTEIGEARSDRRRKTIHAVIAAQQCSIHMSPCERSDFIRSVSECRSFSARAFAELMGQCDSYMTSEYSVKSEQLTEGRACSCKQKIIETIKLSYHGETANKKHKRIRIVDLLLPMKHRIKAQQLK
jgi:hypothetical protein